MSLSPIAACLLVVGIGGCGVAPAHAPPPPPPALPEPPPPAADAPGRDYLLQVYALLRPAWHQFVEDCRLRLPATHPLNQPGWSAEVELRIGSDGLVVGATLARASGERDFDDAVRDVVGELSWLPAPPPELRSDDGVLRLRWLFARDRRGAGPATARAEVVRLAPAPAIAAFLGRGELDAALARLAEPAISDDDRVTLTDQIARRRLLDGALGDSEAARREALAGLRDLPAALALSSAELTRLRVAAASERDPATTLAFARALAAGSRADARAVAAQALVRSTTAAEAAAASAVLRELGDSAAVAGVVDVWVARQPPPSDLVLAALAVAPSLARRPWIEDALQAGGATTQARACVALAAVPALDQAGVALLVRATRSPHPEVRAACLAALGGRRDGGVEAALRRALDDGDDVVRAAAVATLATQGAATRAVLALDDRPVEVAIALAGHAYELGLTPARRQAYLGHADERVRAAALRAALAHGDVGAIGPAALRDPSAEVRRLALAAGAHDVGEGLVDDEVLEVRAASVATWAARAPAAAVRVVLARLGSSAPVQEQLLTARVWLARPRA